jgi:hypothetical protein
VVVEEAVVRLVAVVAIPRAADDADVTIILIRRL